MFLGVRSAIVNDVIPALEILYAALRGDDVAQQTVVDAVLRTVDELLGRRGLVYDFWLVLTGRGFMIGPDSAVMQLRARIDEILEDGSVLEGLWLTLTGRGDTLPEDHPLNQIKSALDYITTGVKGAREALATLWKPIEEKTGLNGVEAGILGAIGMRLGGGALLGGAVRGVGVAGGAALGALASPAVGVIALTGALALAVTNAEKVRSAFTEIGRIIGVDLVGAFDRFEQQHPVLIALAKQWGENVAFVIGKFGEFLADVIRFAEWSLGYNPNPDQYKPDDPNASVIDRARADMSRSGQNLNVTAPSVGSPFKSFEQLRAAGLLKTGSMTTVPRMSMPSIPASAQAAPVASATFVLDGQRYTMQTNPDLLKQLGQAFNDHNRRLIR